MEIAIAWSITAHAYIGVFSDQYVFYSPVDKNWTCTLLLELKVENLFLLSQLS